VCFDLLVHPRRSTMFKRMIGRVLALLVTGVLLLAACGSAPSGQTGGSQAPAAAQPSGTTTSSDAAAPSSPSPAGSSPSSSTSTITDQAGLIDALRAMGLAVEKGGMVSQPFFDVQGSSLRVQGADVQVFEFADADAAQAAMATIGPDGNPATMMITWVAAPHFYQAGQVIVLYIGNDTAITDALTDVMGPQVAGQ
jgi:hypothetical protein